MNELCNNFELYSISKVESVDGNTIVLKAGAVPVKLVADSVELNPSSTTGTSGTLITLESEILVEKVTTEVSIRYANARKAVLVFKKISGEPVVVGSPAFPTRVNIVPMLSRDRVKIRCNSLRSPL